MKEIEIKNIEGGIFFTHEVENNTAEITVTAMLAAYAGKKIVGVDLSGYVLDGVSFDNSSFYNSRFYNSSFDNSSFYNSSFYNSSFYNSRFYNSSFYNSRFYNSSFDNSSFYNSRFYNSRFYNSSFDNSRFYNSSFDNKTVENIVKDGQEHIFAISKNDVWAILLPAKNEIAGLKNALIEGKINGTAYTGDCACLVGTIAKVRQCDYELMPHITPDGGRPAEMWFRGIDPGMTPENSPKVKLTMKWIDEFESLLNA